MNASTFRRRFSLAFAALMLTPLLASGAPVSMDFKVLIDADNTEATGCTVVTTDGSRAAHWEHTVAITADGPWVLTALD